MQACRQNKPYVSLAACLLFLLFSQCVSREDELVPLPSMEADMEMDLPEIMAPEIEMEEQPDYEKLFGQNLSIGVVEDIQGLGSGGVMLPSTISLLDIFLAHARELDPQLQALAGTINIDFLVKMIDHRNPLDPKLEEFLQKMVQKEKDRLFLTLMPLVNPYIAADKKIKTGETNGPPKQEIFRTNGEKFPCSDRIDLYIRESYRYCGVGVGMFEDQLNQIYAPLISDARTRLNDRGRLIDSMYEQKLVLVATIIRDMVAKVNMLSQLENHPDLKKKLGYFGVVYAYAIRVYLFSIYDLAINLNAAYYEKEIQLIEAAKEPELEKIWEWSQKCNEDVKINARIMIDNECPGYRPPGIYD